MISLALLTLLSAAADKPVTLALKGVDVPTLCGLLADVAELKPEVDACVAGKRIDVDFKSKPVKDVLATLDKEVGTISRAERGVLRVTCKIGTQNKVMPVGRPAVGGASDGSPLPKNADEVRQAFEELQHDMPVLLAKGTGKANVLEILDRIFVVDQGVRKIDDHQAAGALMGPIDAFSRETLKEILKSKSWITISEYGDQGDKRAWLIVQHADRDVAFQKDAGAAVFAVLPPHLIGRLVVGEGHRLRRAGEEVTLFIAEHGESPSLCWEDELGLARRTEAVLQVRRL